MARKIHRLTIEVLLALEAEGGRVQKRRFQAIFAELRQPWGRTDMNYGAWIAHDDSTIIQNEGDGEDPSDWMSITELGRERLAEYRNGKIELIDEPQAVDEEEEEEEMINEQFAVDSGGERLDDHIARKVRDPKA